MAPSARHVALRVTREKYLMLHAICSDDNALVIENKLIGKITKISIGLLLPAPNVLASFLHQLPTKSHTQEESVARLILIVSFPSKNRRGHPAAGICGQC